MSVINAWAIIALYLLWIFGAAGMAVIVSRHLWVYNRCREKWGFTGLILLGLAILGIADALSRTFWLPWYLAIVLDRPEWQEFLQSHLWIVTALSVVIVIGYWITGLAFNRVHRNNPSATQDIREIQRTLRDRGY